MHRYTCLLVLLLTACGAPDQPKPADTGADMEEPDLISDAEQADADLADGGPRACQIDIDCMGQGLCHQGRCLDAVCRPEEIGCRDQDIVACAADGQSFQLVESCPLNTLCVRGQCRDLICIPGESICAGNNRSICNEEGTGSQLRPCLGQQICFEGQCIDPVCQGEETTCLDDGTLGRCQGGGFAALPCQQAQRCLEGACVPFHGLDLRQSLATAAVERPAQGALSLWLSLEAAPQGESRIFAWGGLELWLRPDPWHLALHSGPQALELPVALELEDALHLQVAWGQGQARLWRDGFLEASGPLEDAPQSGALTLGHDQGAGWPGAALSVQVGAPVEAARFVPTCDQRHQSQVSWAWHLDEGQGAQAAEAQGGPALALSQAAWLPGRLGLYARDADDDGWGFGPEAEPSCGPIDEDDVLRLGDCNDGNPSIYPTAPELEDLIDNDCDQEIDEDQ